MKSVGFKSHAGQAVDRHPDILVFSESVLLIGYFPLEDMACHNVGQGFLKKVSPCSIDSDEDLSGQRMLVNQLNTFKDTTF